MNINYLMLVHKNPIQVKRLINALWTEGAEFFIHVDKKVDIENFKKLISPSDKIHYVPDDKRIDGHWGDLSLMEATMSMMRMVLERKYKGHCVLLSGQDYPLRSNDYIVDYLSRHENQCFINVYPIPDPKKISENGGLERFTAWTFDCRNPNNPRMKAKITPFSFRLKTLGGFIRLTCHRCELLPKALKCWFRKRHYPKGLAMLFNEFWCTLTCDAVKKLIDEYDHRPELQEYYRYFHIPDESMIAGILCSDPDFVAHLMPMCHYIDWKNVDGGSPKTLITEDLQPIQKAMANKPWILFARKFEAQSVILDEIDKWRNK